MKTVIKVENLSKEYRLGEVGTGTISRDLNAWWANVRGKENPNLKLDIVEKSEGKVIHQALKDISFTVNEGDVLGIIGKNISNVLFITADNCNTNLHLADILL